MSPRLRSILTIAAVPAALLLLTLAAYAFDRIGHSDKVARNVTVAGVDVSGVDEAGVRRAIGQIEAEFVATPALFVVNGAELVLDPALLDVAVDADIVVGEAMAVGRSGGFLSQFIGWLGQVRGATDLHVPLTISVPALDRVLAAWDVAAIGNPGFEGAINIVGGAPQPQYPAAGARIERTAAMSLIVGSLIDGDGLPVELPIESVEPRLAPADVDAALTEARLMLSGPITLSSTRPAASFTFTEEQLASAFRSVLVEGSPPRLELEFDPTVVAAILEPSRDDLEHAPTDASFRLRDDDSVIVVPSTTGTVIDAEAVTDALFVAAHTEARIGLFPFAEGDPPAFSTADAEAMLPITEVSSFTTNHPCCAPRVTNIQLFADIVDGTIVMPGETLSLNEVVGRRDTARGFVAAPAVERDRVVEVVGGGVSQFVTTFYNAVFFSGYEDTEHWPHSWYFSRYPEGREATISWPAPDLRFTNDSDAIVLIDTLYTDTSITVRFFGNNGGREVTAGLSDRFNFTDPPVWYEANEEIVPGDPNVLQDGTRGWSVTVTRVITYPDGSEKVEERTHRYRPRPRVLEVHPCEIPRGEDGHTGEECPILIPELIGLAPGDARSLLETLGLRMSIGAPVEVTVESGLHELVAEQESGLVLPGTRVEVRLGEVPPDATTTTTTTSTTSTTTTTTTVP